MTRRADNEEESGQSAMSTVAQQDDPDGKWQAARRRVLLRCDLKCEACGAEDGKRVWHYLYAPGWWTAVTPGQKPCGPKGSPSDALCAVDVKVIVIATTKPWTGEDEDLVALCTGCWVAWDVAQTLAKLREAEGGLKERQPTLFGT